jgi:hypothetical protein
LTPPKSPTYAPTNPMYTTNSRAGNQFRAATRPVRDDAPAIAS